MKIREMITKDERFSKQVLNKHMEASKENLYMTGLDTNSGLLAIGL